MKFPKAYEPDQYEPDIYALWEKSGAFKKDKNKDAEPYTIVMPPPNANGNLHIGHGLTIALEDILTRYHRLKGNNTWYIPGADHAGFETWVVYERKLEAEGKSRFDFSREQLYQQVWDFVHLQRGNMELQIRALGASCDWDSLTFTLDNKVTNQVYKTFKKMWQDDLIYRDTKLVNFCTKHQTAFADIEVVHKDEDGKLWDIAYPLATPDKELKEIVISTTRPETLLGDTAIAVNPDDKRYKHLVGKKVKLPLTDREIPIIADEHADPEYGTGVVKITPAHDPNDYEVGERHNLPKISVIGFDGKMTADAGANYEGLTTEEARKKVLKNLETQNLLRGEKKVVHSVGHCYKCGTIIEPLLKEQWFINTKPLAKHAIEVLEEGRIKFYPASKQKALINYLQKLKDWNISRQIPWGIPIPAFQNIDDPEDWIFNIDTTKETIEVDGKTYQRDEDTFDTWFSSAQWPVILTNEDKKHYPTSVMETGADILFPWVSRMIMLGLYINNEVPFKDVYLHGLVLDEYSQKMSKSKGNVVNPMEIIAKYGSDSLRMGLVASRSAGINQAFSNSKVIASRNLCNKLWNISRFIQQMVDESDSSNLKESSMSEDWIKKELTIANRHICKLLSQYRFAEASEILYDVIWNKYADWFIESEKLWKNTKLLQDTLTYILIMLHPFAPFVTEAIWQNLTWTEGVLANQKWPEELVYDAERAANFEDIIIIVSSVRSHLASLKTTDKPKIIFGNDPIVDDNQVLIQFLTKASSTIHSDNPKGLNLNIEGHKVYLDLPEKVIEEYKETLEQKILNLGKEIEILARRLSNENYIKKAPESLIQETKESVELKSQELQTMKTEYNQI